MEIKSWKTSEYTTSKGLPGTIDQKLCFRETNINMIDAQECDGDKVTCFYDLYQDLIVYPNGDIVIDGMDYDRALENIRIF